MCTSAPISRVAHRPARVVIAARAGAMSSRTSVQDPTGHPAVGQRQRRLSHTNVTGDPNAARSANSTRSRSLTRARPPHAPQNTTRSVVSTTSHNRVSNDARDTSTTSTRSNPNINSGQRLRSKVTGGLSFKLRVVEQPGTLAETPGQHADPPSPSGNRANPA